MDEPYPKCYSETMTVDATQGVRDEDFEAWWEGSALAAYPYRRAAAAEAWAAGRNAERKAWVTELRALIARIEGVLKT